MEDADILTWSFTVERELELDDILLLIEFILLFMPDIEFLLFKADKNSITLMQSFNENIYFWDLFRTFSCALLRAVVGYNFTG